MAVKSYRFNHQRPRNSKRNEFNLPGFMFRMPLKLFQTQIEYPAKRTCVAHGPLHRTCFASATILSHFTAANIFLATNSTPCPPGRANDRVVWTSRHYRLHHQLPRIATHRFAIAPQPSLSELLLGISSSNRLLCAMACTPYRPTTTRHLQCKPLPIPRRRS
jgi:hypothetical protein